jgi:hypothetical protein
MLGLDLLVVAQTIADDIGAVVAAAIAKRMRLDLNAADGAREGQTCRVAIVDRAKDLCADVHATDSTEG